MTTNHPVPTPPPSEPAPSLRPECEHHWISSHQPDFPDAIYWIDTCSACGEINAARLAEEVAPLLARLRAAEETLAAVGKAIDRLPRRSGTPEWSTAASVAQAAGYDMGLAVASDAVRAALAEGASR